MKDNLKNQIDFDIAQRMLNEYHELCDTGGAQCDRANFCKEIWTSFFRRHKIADWTAGAVLLGCEYYAQYLNVEQMKRLKTMSNRLCIRSELANKLLTGAAVPADFKNVTRRYVHERLD